MTKKAQTMKRGIALLVGCLVGIPAVSQAAQERKSPLADAPAIRKRIDLRNKRFELGVGLASTVGQDFYNALLLNLRLGFHITDWIGISVSAGVFNLTPNWRSSFNNQLNDGLSSSCRDGNFFKTPQGQAACSGTSGKSTPATDKTPTQSEAASSQNHISQVILPQVEITPFTGKFSLFGKLFMNYDFYVSGGPGFINLVTKSAKDGNGQTVNPVDCSTDPATKERVCTRSPYTGWKIPISLGFGMHAFANDFVAINVEVHNLMFKNNAAGRDVTGSKDINSQDLQWTFNWMVGLNCTFFLPATAKVSR
jgi:hypothetical protein